MKVAIDFATSASIIEFCPFLGNDIEIYQKAFEDWYYERTPMGDLRPRSKFIGIIFDGNVIIDWIKEVAPEANPIMIVEEMNLDDVDPSLPGIYF